MLAIISSIIYIYINIFHYIALEGVNYRISTTKMYDCFIFYTFVKSDYAIYMQIYNFYIVAPSKKLSLPGQFEIMFNNKLNTLLEDHFIFYSNIN